MKHDPFEFHGEMTWRERLVRAVFLCAIVAVVAMDLFVWRPN